MLHPGEVGIAGGRDAVLPTGIVVFDAGAPLFHVEGWIGHDEVGAQIGVPVVAEAVGRFFAEVEVDAADGHVHGGQAPGGGVGFLAVDGDVAQFAAVCPRRSVRFARKNPPDPHGGVVDAALEGLQHFDDEGDDGLGGEVLAALFAFGQGELAEKVFVDVAEDVFGLEAFVMKRNGGDEIDEFADFSGIDL